MQREALQDEDHLVELMPVHAVGGMVEDETERRNLRVVVEMVDSWGHYTVSDGEDGGDGLDSACSAKQMARHRLGGIERHMVGMVAK